MDLWLKVATALERGILIILFIVSVWSIAIMIDRWRAFKKQRTETEELRNILAAKDSAEIAKWIQAHPGVHAGTLQTALMQRDPESIDRAVRSYLTDQRLKLERGLPVLATLGANTPFIGLFGTVLGIIRAFAALGENSGAASDVMSGTSQALVATAAGLFVAIPAVIAFNAFSTKLRKLISQCESIKDLYVAQRAG